MRTAILHPKRNKFRILRQFPVYPIHQYTYPWIDETLAAACCAVKQGVLKPIQIETLAPAYPLSSYRSVTFHQMTYLFFGAMAALKHLPYPITGERMAFSHNPTLEVS